MLARRVLFLMVLACTSNGFVLAQVDIQLELIRRIDPDAARDPQRLEDFDIVITIQNGLTTDVEVPRTVESDRLRLCASGSNGTRWPLWLHSRQEPGEIGGGTTTRSKDEATVALKPGDQYEVLRVCTKQTLVSPGNVYARKPLEEFAERRWVWSWKSRLGPDYSPFERRKGDGRATTAVLWCELDMDEQTIRSVPQLVTLKHGDR